MSCGYPSPAASQRSGCGASACSSTQKAGKDPCGSCAAANTSSKKSGFCSSCGVRSGNKIPDYGTCKAKKQAKESQKTSPCQAPKSSWSGGHTGVGSMGGCGQGECQECKEFLNCESDESSECMPDDYRAGLARRRRVRWRNFISKASSIGLPKGDSGAEAANVKIEKDAKALIRKLYKQVDKFFLHLKKCPCKIDRYDFSNTDDLVEEVVQLNELMKSIGKALKYSPLINEITDICEEMDKIVEYARELTALIYVRLVDITFCLHEFGDLIQEGLLPLDFAFAVQKIHTHLRVGFAVYIADSHFVETIEYDSIVATYNKDPRLRRLELLTNCKITMLRPDDPRAVYCPVNFRTIEVEFENDCKYSGFAHLLNRCLTFRTGLFPTRGSTIITRSCASGKEHTLEPAEVEPLRQKLSRTMLAAVEADMITGSKTAAIAPEEKIQRLVQ